MHQQRTRRLRTPQIIPSQWTNNGSQLSSLSEIVHLDLFQQKSAVHLKFDIFSTFSLITFVSYIVVEVSWQPSKIMILSTIWAIKLQNWAQIAKVRSGQSATRDKKNTPLQQNEKVRIISCAWSAEFKIVVRILNIMCWILGRIMTEKTLNPTRLNPLKHQLIIFYAD